MKRIEIYAIRAGLISQCKARVGVRRADQHRTIIVIHKWNFDFSDIAVVGPYHSNNLRILHDILDVCTTFLGIMSACLRSGVIIGFKCEVIAAAEV